MAQINTSKKLFDRTSDNGSDGVTRGGTTTPYIKEPSKTLYERLDSIDKQYSTEYNEPPAFPDSLNTERITVDRLSSDSATDRAKTELGKTYAELRAKLEENIKKKSDDISISKQQALSDKDNQLSALARRLREQLEKAQEKAIEQNISRSSIAQGIKQGAQDDNRYEREQVLREHTQQNSLFDEMIKQLGEQRSQQLDNIEGIYDAELKEKVQQLLEENAKKVLENTKYNNSLESAEAKFDATNLRAFTDAQYKEYTRVLNLLKLVEQVGLPRVEDMRTREKYLATQELFDALDNERAKQLFESERGTLEYHLGKYFDAFAEYMASR